MRCRLLSFFSSSHCTHISFPFICLLWWICLHAYTCMMDIKEYSPYIEWMNECLYTLGIHLAVVSKQFFLYYVRKWEKILLLLFSFPFVYFYGCLWCCFLYVIWISCVKKWHFLSDEGNHGFRYGMAMVRHIDEKWSENSHEFNLSLDANSLIDSLSKEYKIHSLMMKRYFFWKRSKVTFCCR